MTGFADTYLGQLRADIGDRLVLMPGARIVIEDPKGLILLQKRTDFGLWGVPGGGPEPGDNILTAIRREVLEEVGLEVEDPQPFGFASDPAFETIRYPNGHRCQYFVMLFFARRFSGRAHVADDESLEVGWFAPDALPDMLPNMRRTLEAFTAHKHTGAFQMI